MNRRQLLLLTFFFAILACGGGNQAAQRSEGTAAPAADEKKATPASFSQPFQGALAYIEPLVGQRPAAAGLWESEPLRTMLRDLLEEDFDFFLEVMQEAMPLGKEEGVVYTVGVAPDDQVPGVGYLLIDTDKDLLHAFALFGDAEISARSTGADLRIPKAVTKKVQEVIGQ